MKTLGKNAFVHLCIGFAVAFAAIHVVQVLLNIGFWFCAIIGTLYIRFFSPVKPFHQMLIAVPVGCILTYALMWVGYLCTLTGEGVFTAIIFLVLQVRSGAMKKIWFLMKDATENPRPEPVCETSTGQPFVKSSDTPTEEDIRMTAEEISSAIPDDKEVFEEISFTD